MIESDLSVAVTRFRMDGTCKHSAGLLPGHTILMQKGIAMPEVTSHLPGMPCWAELATTDDQGAISFYSTLFGWQDSPQEIGPNQYYHMQELKGLPVGALYQQGDEEKAQGVPPHWKTYFSVSNADEAAGRAKGAGAMVILEPFDVFDAGRMAVLQDPQGAIFAVWQPNVHVGYRLMDEPGTRIWNELLTNDPAAATAFYSEVLGVSSEKMPGPMDYTILKVGEIGASGVMQISPEMGPIPPNWSVYFMVDDVDASADESRSLGGSVAAGPQDIPEIGRFAVIQDPQGAAFGLFKPASVG